MHRRFQFSISTAIWLVVVCAVAMGWWRQRIVHEKELQHLRSKVQQEETLRQAITYALNHRVLMAARYGLATPGPGDEDDFAINSNVPMSSYDDVGQLVDVLRTGTAQQRASAAHRITVHGEFAAEAIPVLLELLRNEVALVRWHAALALGSMGKVAGAAVPFLEREMNDEQSTMPAFAARMLRRIDSDAEITPRLIALLSDSRTDTRWHAAAELVLLDQERELSEEHRNAARPKFTKLLRDEDPRIRLAAVTAVARWALPKQAISRLVDFYRDEQVEWVKYRAAEKLLRLSEADEN